MKLILLQILLVIFGTFLGIICHGMLEKSCNDSGGSYLGGHCILNEYQDCKRLMDSQSGIIAVLPMKCAKYNERLYQDQK